VKTYALGALLVVLAGCFVPSTNEKDDLKVQARVFNDFVRWRRYADAAMLLAPGERPRFLAQARAIADDFEVDDYEVLGTAPTPQGQVEVRVAFDWESKQTGLLRRTEVGELWGRVGKEWVLAALRHRGGQAVPLFGGQASEASEK
jgi:hypothetical protein